MIANTDLPGKRGSEPTGLMFYLFDEGREEEHVDPRVIGSWDDRVKFWGAKSPAELGAALQEPVDLVDPEMKKFVYHLRLRNPDSDQVLTDGQWAQVASDAMHATGISRRDDPAGCRWLAVRHDDNHIHVVATLVRQDGKRFWPKDDWPKLRKVCHRSEERFGLGSTAPADQTANADLSRAEYERRRDSGEAPAREQLRKTVRVAAGRAGSLSEMLENLDEAGVQYGFRLVDGYEPMSPGEIDVGKVAGWWVSWPLDDSVDGMPRRFSGGKLAKDLTWPKLTARFADTGRGSTAEQGAGFEDTVLGVRDEALDGGRVEDLGVGISGVASRMAFESEGVAGGPLTDVADEVWRSSSESFNVGRVGILSIQLLGVMASAEQRKQTRLLLALLMLLEAQRQIRLGQQRAHQARMVAEQRARIIDQYRLNDRLGIDPQTVARAFRVQPGLSALDQNGDTVMVEQIDADGRAVVNNGTRRVVMAEAALRPVRFVAQRFEPGAIVKPDDRRNVGTVVDVNGDEVGVLFKNPKTGKQATRTFSRRELEVLRPAKKTTNRQTSGPGKRPSQGPSSDPDYGR